MSTTEPPAPAPSMPARSGRTGGDNPDYVHPSPTPTRFTLSRLFFGPDGLRPIWGILLFLMLWQLLRELLIPFSEILFRPAPASRVLLAPGFVSVSEGAELLSIVLPTWLLSRLESRPFSTYGFGLQRRAARLSTVGVFWGAALLSLLIAALRALGLLVFDARLLHGLQMLRYGILWAAAFLLVAMAEETLLRGYLQFTLSRGLSQVFRLVLRLTCAHPTHARPARWDAAGFWTAALLLSAIFGLGHRSNPGESPLGLFAATAVGLVFCLSLRRTGSLWWAIGFHAAWDWAESFLYGVPDSGLLVLDRLLAAHPVGAPILSGGLTGPEGSLLLVPILFAAIGIILLTLPRNPVASASAVPPSVPLD